MRETITNGKGEYAIKVRTPGEPSGDNRWKNPAYRWIDLDYLTEEEIIHARLSPAEFSKEGEENIVYTVNWYVRDESGTIECKTEREARMAAKFNTMDRVKKGDVYGHEILKNGEPYFKTDRKKGIFG